MRYNYEFKKNFGLFIYGKLLKIILFSKGSFFFGLGMFFVFSFRSFVFNFLVLFFFGCCINCGLFGYFVFEIYFFFSLY